MNKYRYYNSTNAVYETVLSDVVPTECLNNAHTFDSVSLTVINEGLKVNDGTTIHQQSTLEAYKVLKNNEIDARTGELIAAGFVYSSKTFSLSQNAQLNLNGANQSRDELTYPVRFYTIDSLDYHDTVDAADLHSLYLTALSTKKGHIDSGGSLRESVNAATDKNGVNAVTDNR